MVVAEAGRTGEGIGTALGLGTANGGTAEALASRGFGASFGVVSGTCWKGVCEPNGGGGTGKLVRNAACVVVANGAEGATGPDARGQPVAGSASGAFGRTGGIIGVTCAVATG